MNCPLCRIEFEEEDKRTLFLSANLECKICLLKKDSSEFECLKCGHAFCKTCLDQVNKDTRNPDLTPELWLSNYYPTLNYVSRHWMRSENWPEHVIEYVELNWFRYPNVPNWPQNCICYYKFYYDNNFRFV